MCQDPAGSIAHVLNLCLDVVLASRVRELPESSWCVWGGGFIALLVLFSNSSHLVQFY